MERYYTGVKSRNELLEAVKSYWQEHQRPPTYRELAEETGMVISQVYYHMTILEKAGKIEREPGKARTIRVIEEN